MIWLEIHCDAMGNSVDPCGKAMCYSKSGGMPGKMSRTTSGIADNLRALKGWAIKDGWRLSAGKWTCPACLPKPPARMPIDGPVPNNMGD